MKPFALQCVAKMSSAKKKVDCAGSGMPIMLDDVRYSTELKEWIVNGFTGVGESDSTAKNAFAIKCGMILATNFKLDEVERYTHACPASPHVSDLTYGVCVALAALKMSQSPYYRMCVIIAHTI